MAESNRRGDEEDATEHVDDVFDDAVDDDADDDGDTKTSRGGGTAIKERAKSEQTEKVGIFGRVGRFVREVIGELRKVIWPTRNELLTYTAVVVVFVAFMLAIVAGLDYVFARGVLFVFGNPK